MDWESFMRDPKAEERISNGFGSQSLKEEAMYKEK